MSGFVYDPDYASEILMEYFSGILNKEQADAIAHLTELLERAEIRRQLYQEND